MSLLVIRKDMHSTNHLFGRVSLDEFISVKEEQSWLESLGDLNSEQPDLCPGVAGYQLLPLWDFNLMPTMLVNLKLD